MDNKLLESALFYNSIGWSVIPLAEGLKVPPKDFKVIPFRETLASPEQIRQWWSENPNYNIGIVTGKLSNLFVVDIDTEEGFANIDTYIPDSVVTPTATTPRGGMHLYFKYPQDSNLTIGAGVIKGTDYRGEGGYVVAAPSINGNGKPYAWTISPFDKNVEFADLPYIYIKKLFIYRDVTKTENHESSTSTNAIFNLNKGYRDATLFHVANTMIKGGAKKEETLNVLKILASHCNPPFPENEFVTKCNSALDRAARKERNISQEISDFIAVTSGYFSVTSCYSVLQVVTKEDKTAIRVALNRLKDKGIVKRHPTTDGLYSRVETDFNFITFDEDEAPEVEYPVKLPLGLNDIAEVSQGNIILVAGEFNAGKTSFLLNILKDNKNKLPIRYITSEMSKSEFKKRFATFALPLKFWMQDDMTEYVKKSSDFHTAIKPNSLNIIDYMEFKDSDYTKGAEYLTNIHDALQTGIAIVAIQKKEGTRMPRSGDLVIEKPRLAISIAKINSQNERPEGYCEILKCKMPKSGKVDGKKFRFEISNQGSKFIELNSWGYWRF